MFIVDDDTSEGVIRQLKEAGKEISSGEERKKTADPFVNDDDDDDEGEGRNESGNGVLGPPFGIVLNGHSLVGLLPYT